MTGEGESVSGEKSKGLLVSVIIPVYQVSDYVERCLSSVMNQTYQNIECIIVDDASPDDSIAKCERLIECYHGPIKFQILHHERNRGLSAARNTGTGIAKGDYILYLDGDDELTCYCVEKLINPVLKDHTIEMVLGDVVCVSKGNAIIRKERFRSKLAEKNLDTSINVRDFFFCEKRYYVKAWNRLVSRKFLLYNNLVFKEGIILEDVLWNFYVMKNLKHLYVVPEVTYIQYKRPDSIMTGTEIAEIERNYSIIYTEIATNFSKGIEGKKEVWYYYRHLCSHIIYHPQFSKCFSQSILLFKEALSKNHDVFRPAFLNALEVLSKYRFGIVLFSSVVKIRETYRSLFV